MSEIETPPLQQHPKVWDPATLVLLVILCVFGAIIGVQMACAYVGTCLMPPLFGLLAQHISVSLLPAYLLVILVLMAVMHESLIRKIAKTKQAA